MSDRRKDSKWIIKLIVFSSIAVSILIVINVWIITLPAVDWISKILAIISDSISVVISIFVGRYYVGKILQDRGFDLDLVLQGIRFVQEQKLEDRKRKKDYDQKMVEDVYIPLYRQINDKIIPTLEKKPFSLSLKVFFSEWERIKKGPKEVFMNARFKKRLNDLSTALNTHYDNVYNFKAKTLPDIFNEEANRIYQPPDKTKFKLEYNYKENKRPVNTDLYNPYDPEGNPYYTEGTEAIIKCLRTNTNPKDYIKKPGRIITGFWIKDIASDWANNDETQFNKFWESFKNRVDQNEEFINIPTEANNIVVEAKEIMKQLYKYIKKLYQNKQLKTSIKTKSLTLSLCETADFIRGKYAEAVRCLKSAVDRVDIVKSKQELHAFMEPAQFLKKRLSIGMLISQKIYLG